MKCIQCGNEQFVKAIEREQRTVGGREFSAGLRADKCTRCGDTFVKGEALADFEKLVAFRLAQEGPASGESFKFLRKAIAQKAADLAALLGIAPETISRWENDQRPVDLAAWATLAAIVVEHLEGKTLTLERLRSAAKKQPRRVEFGELPEDLLSTGEWLGLRDEFLFREAQVRDSKPSSGSTRARTAVDKAGAPKRTTSKRPKDKRR